MTDAPTFTITLEPGQWSFAHIYQPHGFAGREPKHGLAVTDAALLPEEVTNEVRIARNGFVYLEGFKAPVVSHHLGWEKLESELRRMEATNQSPDGMFEGCTLEVTFFMFRLEPRPGSRYDTPYVVAPVKSVHILKGQDEC